MPNARRPFELHVKEWVALIATAVTGAAGLTSFAYQTFQTKPGAMRSNDKIEAAIESLKQDMVKRSDRIEDKLDRVIEMRRK